MKKILACLLVVVLLCSLSIMLFSCDADELKKLEYVDENGNIAKTSVKKTDDPDKVTAAVCALANKQIDTRSLYSLLVSASVNGSLSGTQNDKAWDANLGASATVGIALPEYYEGMKVAEFANGLKLYADISAQGKLPKNIGALNDDDDETPYPDLTDTVDLNESLKLYLDTSKIYTKAAISEGAIAAMPDFESLIAMVNNKTGKIDLSTYMSMIIGLIGVKEDAIPTIYSSIQDANNSYLKVINSYNSKETDTEDPSSVEANIEFDYANVKKFVEAFNIKITKTKGSVATFSATINAESMKKLNAAFPPKEGEDPEFDEDFKGTIDVVLSIDAKTMLDVSLTVTASGFGEMLANAEEGVVVNTSSATINATISTQGIPTISDEEKEAAQAINAMDFLSELMKIIMSK